MNCIFDLNFDILNKINGEVIKKGKLMKYLDNKEIVLNVKHLIYFTISIF
jgi:hypothetical protein